MGVTTIESLNDSQWQTQGEEYKDEEEENTNIDKTEEKNEDGEQGI